ncbi:MAG: isoprenyl transferase [Thermoflexales bacterium]|nr:isoprenyl transferase [Thermoflexales bacterium]MCS7324846.1 isoprenyl transferase [Thermoflexales bacterium]MCX7938272.1 isoprenyl transferase [Thermoflexales bacterium]MDW8054940.1 isoprenyl transferase [Anaerolineae bacterium]MDW8293491.1 isoprenyl transferase [Anaerolineae bacterium]
MTLTASLKTRIASLSSTASAEKDALLPPPQHIAIIMDGNGRWAKARNLPRLAGHRAGTENLRRVLRACKNHGVKIVTLYAFSTENWRRPAEEVEGLMKLLETYIDRELEALHREGVQIRHLGRLERIPPALQRKIQHAIEYTRNNTELILNVALNYGGRAEIVDAARRMLAEGLRPEDVTEATFSRYLYTTGLPDPDLIIRTSGEYRVSNFLIWQGAYAEYYITEVLWPDFDEKELAKAIEHYRRRERRFGGLKA